VINAADNEALGRLARNDGESILVLPVSILFEIQAEFAFPLSGIGTVAGETFVREHRPNVFIEIDLCGYRHFLSREECCGKDAEDGADS
jgi:hypothetical protein